MYNEFDKEEFMMDEEETPKKKSEWLTDEELEADPDLEAEADDEDDDDELKDDEEELI